MKQDEKQDNLTLSQLIQLHSLAYSRQPIFQRQVNNFMKVLFLFDHRKWGDKSTKCEAIKCTRQKQSKGDKKFMFDSYSQDVFMSQHLTTTLQN